MKPNEKGLKRIVSATGYSIHGMGFAWKNEAAFRQEIILLLVLVPFGIWLGSNGVERALLVGSCFIVIIVELLNSGIEAVIDRIGADYHKLSGAAKDLGSAAVFFSLVLVVVTWTTVLWGNL